MKKIILKVPEVASVAMGAPVMRHANAFRSKREKANGRQALKRRLAREGW